MLFKPSISNIACGASIATLAIGLEVFGVVPVPHAYGFCVSCHSRELIVWVMSKFYDVAWGIATSEARYPLLTTVGLFSGGLVASRLAGEYRLRRPSHRWQSVAAGVLASNLALVALGCPARQVLRLGYGDWAALPAALGFVVGAALGTLIIKWRALKL